MTKTVEISLNGHCHKMPYKMPLDEALVLWQEQQQVGKKFAVAINGEFIARARYAEIFINENDKIDIVQAVGGG